MGFVFPFKTGSHFAQPRLASNIQCSHHQSLTLGLHAWLVCISVSIQQCELHPHICISNTHNLSIPEATDLSILHNLATPSTALVASQGLTAELPGDLPRQQQAAVSSAGFCNEHNTLSHVTSCHGSCWAHSSFTPRCFLTFNLNYF